MMTEDVNAGCTACSRDHFTTIACSLNEAARMSKSISMSSPEIQERIAKSEEELNAVERYDLSPDKLAKMPTGEREVLRDLLKKARENIRQQLEITGLRWGNGTITDLEDVASAASDISKEFRERITPFYVERVGKLRGWKTSTGQTSVSDNTWIWWIVGGALAGFMGWLMFKKKEEEVV